MGKKTQPVHIVFVLDRSGSMEWIKHDAAGGFNAFVEEQRKLPGKARITLIQFDDRYEVNCEKVKLKDAPTLVVGQNYIPRGSTALNDALGKAVTSHESEERVIVAVFTDGQENASREYTTASLKALVERKQADGWEFHYLSSDLNTFANAAALGVRAANTMQVSPDSLGTQCAYSTLTKSATKYRDAARSN